MLVVIVAPLLAGLLGLATDQAEDSEAYLTRLRFLLIGAALLGYLAVAWFAWRRGKGLMRFVTVAVGLLGVRIVYPIVPYLGTLVTGWLVWAARKLGADPSGAMVHYSLGVFIAAFSVVAALLTMTAVANLTHAVKWVVVLAVLGAVGFFDVTQENWSINPHPFRKTGAAPSGRGPSYREVAEDSELPWRQRVGGLVGWGLHAVWPRSGWGGSIRTRLDRNFRGNPDGTLQDRVTELEAALVQARP